MLQLEQLHWNLMWHIYHIYKLTDQGVVGGYDGNTLCEIQGIKIYIYNKNKHCLS